jgi:peptidoglycan/LPS O-acetylase OafA/YrhL
MTGPSTHIPKDYRPDIDGLRAVAVLSVLAFHAFPQYLSGGFVGVDVFFVISGYLISRIIIGDLSAGTFTFANFYSRRIRRIFPALFLVLAFVTVVGWYVLLPADFRQLGGHVFAGAGFVANLLLWYEVGYFDTVAELKPTLHLWSLGIEEQYYLVWPLLLIGFRRHTRWILWFVIVIALASFAINVWATPRYPSAAFYLPPTRFWQLMVGGILAYWHVKNIALWPVLSRRASHPLFANTLSVSGLAMLVAGFVLIRGSYAFPGWWALLPTIGTAMLIGAGQDTWINRTMLSNRGMVYVGLISYPLYLWHWPLLTFSRIINDGHPVPYMERLVLLGFSVVLSVLTYEVVEKNVRYARKTRWAPGVVPALATSIGAVAVVGLLASAERIDARSGYIPQLAGVSYAFDDWEDFNGSGRFSGMADRKVLFFGDSHMAQYMPRIESLAGSVDGPVRAAQYKISYGCAPVPGVERRNRSCDRFVSEGYAAAMEETVDVVVIGASWLGLMSRDDLYRIEDGPDQIIDPATDDVDWIWEGLEQEISRMVSAGKRVAIILNAPVGEEFDPRAMVSRDGLDLALAVSPPQSRTRITEMNEPVNSHLIAIANRTGAELVDPVAEVCGTSHCPTTDSDGKPLYKDHSHFRASFIRNKFDALDEFVLLPESAGIEKGNTGGSNR